MSKRAVDFAFNKFPFRYDAHGDVIDFEQTVVLQGVCRIGYEQAEKDLALTWEDIRTIFSLLDETARLLWSQDKKFNDKELCEETLRKFNESRRTRNEEF